MNTLKTIQVLAKIGRIISKIIFILCIVGFCCCAIGIITLAAGTGSIVIGGVTIHSIIENEAGLSLGAMYAAMAVGIVLCAAEAVLCKFAEIYFKNELKDGTPFTLRGAKELLMLGILTVAISLGAVIICSIGLGIARHFVDDIEKISLSGFGSVGLGISMIILSLFCRHGAEISEENAELKAGKEQ